MVPRARWSLRLAIVLAAIGCNRHAPEVKPPVIVISVDTLRSDHLPAYGYHGVETPAIDALAGEAVVYDHAFSHCPLTLPSYATLFTGLLPAGTGIRDNLGFRLGPRPTLAQTLRQNGYATGAAVSAYVLRAESGINRGFDFYDDRIAEHADQALGGIQRSGAETEAIAEKWIGAHSGRPFFFFLHLYEPHAPYDAPEPYRSRYKPYDAEIASADAIVGRFLNFLKAGKLYDRALIVFLSDHGEGLGDHGEDEHGIFLYREALQVPLMVKRPGAAGGSRDATNVGLSDVMAMILSDLHIALPAGVSAGPPQQIYSETFYPRFHFGWSDLHALISGTKHYIEAPRAELYDLGADPAERRNLAGEDRRTLFAMKQAIAPLVTAAAEPQAVPPEEAAKLAALGYISGGAPAQRGGALPDPKDKVETFRDLRKAFSWFRAGKNAEALHAFRQILRENPGMTDVWDVTAKAEWRLGHSEAAITAAKQGLAGNPRSATLAMTVAGFALQAGHPDEARKHAELALALGEPRAHEILAGVFLARGDLAHAESEARLALDDGDPAAARVILARVLKEEKRYEEALAALDEAQRWIEVNRKPPFAGLAYLRGDLLARLGRSEEAERSLKAEIALAPADPRAYQSLIVLLVSEGRGDEATRLVYQLIGTAPTAESYAAIVDTMKTLGDGNGARFWVRRGLQQYPHDARLRRLAL